MELNRLCEAVILANKLHEESFVASTPQSYGRYTRSWAECVNQAMIDVFDAQQTEWRGIVWFLAVSGEGVDICRGVSERNSL